jgi:L-iditol 2-dehydrogenase
VLDPRADDVVDQVKDLTDGRGAAGGIETSGAPGAAALLGRTVRVRGGLAVVAWTPETTFSAMVPGGLDIYACWHWNHQHHLADMWTMIRESGPAIDTMVTHRMPLEDVASAMDLQDAGECGKIILHPFSAEEGRR